MIDSGTPEVLKGFVAIEGLDGSGTSTLLSLLEKRLAGNRVNHHCTYEPTDGDIGRLIRDILHKRISVQPRTLALLFAADRTEHVGEIRSRLRKGQIVVTDRYLFSSLAYQGNAGGFDYVFSLNRGFPLPSQVFFLDTPLDLCQQRMESRDEKDLFDMRSTQEKVLAVYGKAFSLFQKAPVEFINLDGRLEPAEILENMWRSLEIKE